VHHSAEDHEEPDATAPQRGRFAAAGALIITLAGIGIAHADDETRRPAITVRGWQLDLTGYIQVDAIPWSQDSYDELDPATRDQLNDERFLIRRGRLRAEAHRGAAFGALELDGNTIDGSAARILAAQVGWTFTHDGAPLLTLSAGLFKTPFGAEVPAAERDKAFVEPPAFARALFPGSYDAGAMVSGQYGLARWSLAIMNGVPAGDAQWHGADPVQSFELVGRIGTVIEPRDDEGKTRIEAGVSASTGSALSPGTPPTKDELQWVDENGDGQIQVANEIVVIPGGAGAPSQPFDHQALGADIAVHWCICVIGRGTAFAEGVIATNLDRGVVYADPVMASRDLRHLGFAVGVVQSVTDHAVIGVRYDRYDADRDANERLGLNIVDASKIFSTLSIMAAARWNDARLVVQYDRERNPFGRADDGSTATRNADRVTLRAQVGF
jgi:hypothetical protein